MEDRPRILRIFEVAKMLQVTTSAIAETLRTLGFDTSRQAMQPVSEEMYMELLKKFDRNKLHDYQRVRSLVQPSVKPLAAQTVEPALISLSPTDLYAFWQAPTPAVKEQIATVDTPDAPGAETEPIEVIAPLVFDEEKPVIASPESPEIDGASKHLPGGAVFAEYVHRGAPQPPPPPAPESELMPEPSDVADGKRAKKIKEPTSFKLRVKLSNGSPSALKTSLRATGSPVSEEIQLNNIDLELFTILANMTAKEKVELLDNLMT